MAHQARCCCGAFTLELAGEPVLNALCHCDNCKRRTGSAFGWSVYFREEDVGAPSGEGRVYALEKASGVQERWFCAGCGSTLWWRSGAMVGVIGVAGGCLPGVGEPAVSASEDARCPWLELPGILARSP